MDNKVYILPEDKVKLCLNAIYSAKIGRIICPIIFLIANYLFLYSMFGYQHNNNLLWIYLGFSFLTTGLTYWISTSSIKRYNNIIKELAPQIDASISVTTISNLTYSFNKGEFQTSKNLLIINTKNKVEALNIIYNENTLILVPEWFDKPREIIDSVSK